MMFQVGKLIWKTVPHVWRIVGAVKHKFSQKWEGPYIVEEAHATGHYWLKDQAGDLFTNKENQHNKTPSGDFKITTLENPLLSKQAVTSKGIAIPYTNLQLNPYPNTQLDLFCSDNLSFWCTAPSTWLTNCADPSMRLQSPTRKGC